MKDRSELTPKQREILRFIRNKIKLEGLPPTIREIAKQFNFSSTGTVRDYLSALIKKGYIKISSKKSRAIELIKDSLFRVPIVGRVTAGRPNLAFEEIEGYLDLDKMATPQENIFALRIKGDSMLDAGIMPGDLVLVRQQPTAQNGEIVVALIESEATVKTLRRREGKLYLEAANKRYKPILVDKELSIIGKVIGVIRRYV